MSHIFDTDELVGTQVGRYRIDARIARGGMGVLYRAEHTGLARTAALKVIAPELAGNRDYRLRFEREARSAAAIEHPNVVPVWDFAEDRGLLYIAMRYVDGPDLGDIIGRERRLPPQRAAALVSQAGFALDAAHARGLVHRDVKPANMLIEGRDGGEHVWVTDFGLARASARSRTDLTRHGAILGTLDFIAPEQLDDQAIDGRADVYALGCVLFYALCGRVPFPRGNDAQRMRAHALEPPPALPLSELRAFDPVIAKALAKRPEDRFQHAGELGIAALGAARGAPVRQPTPRPHTPPPHTHAPPPQHTPPPPPPPHTPAPRRSVPGWAIPVAAALIALVVGLGVLLASGALGGGGGDEPTPTPGPGDTQAAGAVSEQEAAALMDQFESAFNDHSSGAIVGLMGEDAVWHTPGLVDATTPSQIQEDFDSVFSQQPGVSITWDKVGSAAVGDESTAMKVDMRLYENDAQTGHWTADVTFGRENGEPRIIELEDQ